MRFSFPVKMVKTNSSSCAKFYSKMRIMMLTKGVSELRKEASGCPRTTPFFRKSYAWSPTVGLFNCNCGTFAY
jgi:hypothetical protein